MEKYIKTFYEEAEDLLSKLEIIILDLGDAPDSKDLLNQLLRILHTLKGSANMFGFDRFAAFVHDLETAFIAQKTRKSGVDRELLSEVLNIVDFLPLLISAKEEEFQERDTKEEKFKAILKEYLPERSEPSELDSAAEPKKSEDTNFQTQKTNEDTSDTKKLLWQISFVPHENFYFSGNDPFNIVKDLSRLGKIEVTTIIDSVPELSQIDPYKCYFAFEIYLESSCSKNDILDAFVFVEDLCELEIVSSELFIATDASKAVESIHPQETLKESLHEDDFDKSKTQEPTPKLEQEAPKAHKSDSKNNKPISSSDKIAVDSTKIRALVNLLGEMVTVQARLSQTAESRADAELTTLSRELESLGSQLRENVMNMTMQPLSEIFNKIKVHAASFALQMNRNINLTINGGDIELDKSILDNLFDPITNLIKSILMCSFQTQNNDKNQADSEAITIKAWRVSGNAYIEISSFVAFDKNTESDDLWHPENLKEIINSQSDFYKSLSSEQQEQVAQYCQSMHKLRASLTYNFETQGELTYLLSFPLNLSFIQGLMVKLGEGLFLIPLAVVEECIELTSEDRKRNYDKNVIMVRGQIVPYITLRDTFSVEGDSPDIQQVVITMVDNFRIGFVVDSVVGECQSVIRSWGRFCSDVKGVSGASIIGDGSIALIIDIPCLIREAGKEHPQIMEQKNGI